MQSYAIVDGVNFTVNKSLHFSTSRQGAHFACALRTNPQMVNPYVKAFFILKSLKDPFFMVSKIQKILVDGK
jgi:hypothetical protein